MLSKHDSQNENFLSLNHHPIITTRKRLKLKKIKMKKLNKKINSIKPINKEDRIFESHGNIINTPKSPANDNSLKNIFEEILNKENKKNIINEPLTPIIWNNNNICPFEDVCGGNLSLNPLKTDTNIVDDYKSNNKEMPYNINISPFKKNETKSFAIENINFKIINKEPSSPKISKNLLFNENIGNKEPEIKEQDYFTQLFNKSINNPKNDIISWYDFDEASINNENNNNNIFINEFTSRPNINIRNNLYSPFDYIIPTNIRRSNNYNENIIHLDNNSSNIINQPNNNINNNNNNNNNIINNNISSNENNQINQINYNINNNNNNNNTNNYLDLDTFDDFIPFNSLYGNQNRNKIKEIKNKLTKTRYKKSLQLKERENNCIICLGDFKSNQSIYTLPCSHIFHVRCLNKEVKFRQKCPMCRKQL